MLHSVKNSSISKKSTESPLRVILTLSLFFFLLGCFTACDLIEKEAPDIEGVLQADSQISFWSDIDSMPIDWDRARVLWSEYLPKLKAYFGEELLQIIEQSQVQAEDFSKFVVSIDNYDFTSDIDTITAITQTSWMLAVDFNGYLPADLIEFGINSKTVESGYFAKRNGTFSDFDRIDIHDAKSDRFIFSIAVFTAKTSQIRIGHPDKLNHSILEPAVDPVVAENSLIPEDHLWLHFKVPEELLDEVRQIEDVLPIDTGALLSGFDSVTASYQLTDYALNTLYTLGFEEQESANNAYSILNLSTSFIIKPMLKRSIGDAKHFIKSIQTERNGSGVQYRASINQSDTEAIKAYVEKVEGSPLLSYALDLINSH